MANDWERRIRASLRELETAERGVEDARQAFWDVLAQAHAAGVTLTAIGDILRVSRQRVAQLVDKGRVR